MKSRLISDKSAGAKDPESPNSDDGIAQKAREVREALAVLQVRLGTLPKRKELRPFRDDANEVIRRVVILLEQIERALFP
jgi:hypothetical protein